MLSVRGSDGSDGATVVRLNATGAGYAGRPGIYGFAAWHVPPCQNSNFLRTPRKSTFGIQPLPSDQWPCQLAAERMMSGHSDRGPCRQLVQLHRTESYVYTCTVLVVEVQPAVRSD